MFIWRFLHEKTHDDESTMDPCQSYREVMLLCVNNKSTHPLSRGVTLRLCLCRRPFCLPREGAHRPAPSFPSHLPVPLCVCTKVSNLPPLSPHRGHRPLLSAPTVQLLPRSESEWQQHSLRQPEHINESQKGSRDRLPIILL